MKCWRSVEKCLIVFPWSSLCQERKNKAETRRKKNLEKREAKQK